MRALTSTWPRIGTNPGGDRRQEIVFIGSGIDGADIKARLDAELVLKDVASSPDALPDFPDPFSFWRMAEQAA